MATDRRRFLLIRDTFFEARRLVGGSPVDFDLMRAVWLADLSVELALATIVSDYGLSRSSKNFHFETSLELVKKSEAPELQSLRPFFSNLTSLHQSRNRVHDGDALGVGSARSNIAKAERFLQAVFSDVFGIDLEELSLLSFLKPTRAKEKLEEAQKLIDHGDYNEAAFHIAIALEYIRDEMRGAVASDAPGLSSGLVFGNASLRRAIRGKEALTASESFEELVEAVRNIAFVLELTRFGVETGDAIDFLGSVQKISRYLSSEERWYKLGGDNRTFTELNVGTQLQFLAEVLYRVERHAA